MKRAIYKQLLEWKSDADKRPLLIRGARQTGKTFIVNELGKNEFKQTIYINFERNPEYKEIFNTLVPSEITEKIALFTAQRVEKGSTLLFLDEIQDCPNAIISLRYFYEEMPDLHVIGAGSLLEFALKSESFKMPVGRIQYLYLYPLSFGEFLDALGKNELRNYIRYFGNLKKIPKSLHKKIIDLVRKYFYIGGMPAVVKEYVNTQDVLKCQRKQQSIIDTYIDDFGKYAKRTKHEVMRKVFNTIPSVLGQKYVYANIDRQLKSRELKEALELLETAGVITRVRMSTGSGLPLSSNTDDLFFKVIFLDIGLFHAISGLYAETAIEKDLTAIFKGAVAEQFVGQEIIANISPYRKAGLYYWARKAKNSTAEVDYLIEQGNKITPIEVKSGNIAHMKSMYMFLEKYQIEEGIKVSQAIYENKKTILSLPFYGIEALMKNEG
jgi:hypothetical protein